MDAKTLEVTIRAHLKEISGRLDNAAGITKTAEACAEAGDVPKAIEIARNFEQILYEETTFLDTASMVHRICTT